MKCVTGWSPRSCSLWQWGRNRGPRWGTHRPGLLAIGVLEAAPVKHPGGTSLPCFLLELQWEVPWPPVSTFAPSVPFFFIAFSKIGGWGALLRAIDAATCSSESGVLLQPASGRSEASQRPPYFSFFLYIVRGVDPIIPQVPSSCAV